MIRIIDYGVGNIQAFLNVYKRLGIPVERAREAGDLEDATHLILPGVGAFDHAMQMLDRSGMRTALERLVMQEARPVLGICVGMQMLAEGSDEGELPGLGWIPGRVRSFSSHPASASLPMPHMGWNQVEPAAAHPLFQGFEPEPRFYFLHSYYFECAEAADSAAKAQYGHSFSCIVSRGHIHGVQCHPEKSHHFGAMLLKNFASV